MATAAHARDHEAGRPSERGRDPILEQEHGRGGRGAVLHVDRDGDLRPGGHANVGEAPAEHEALPAEMNRDGGDEGERGQAHAHDLQPGGAEQSGRHPHRHAGPQNGGAASREHQGCSDTGTGTSAMISRTITSGERPVITASAVTMIR